MKTNQLTKSPLSYVLAQVRISPIMNLETFISTLQGSIRKDFPLCNKIQIKAIEFNQQSEPSVKEMTQWHFADKLNITGIIADTNTITIHTTHYETFDKLINKLKIVLDKFNSILEIGLYSRIGIRYINAIHHTPEKYLNKELLGFHLEKNSGFKDKFFIKSETIQETNEGLINIKVSHFNAKEIISEKNILIPQDLMQSASYLALDTNNQAKALSNFAILDIDHFTEGQEKNKDFNITEIVKKIEKLHEGIVIAFENSITPTALEEWK
ncbi:MAG: TIGR04255 family protein [Legionellales bacterium]|nr:TIGR04255 family protein [Legionellales bacterium]